MVVFLLSFASKGANALAEETYSKAGGSTIEGQMGKFLVQHPFSIIFFWLYFVV